MMHELEEILRLSIIQRKGEYTTESDAMTALELVTRLTRAMIALRKELGLA